MKLFWGTDIKQPTGLDWGYYIHNMKLREKVEELIDLEPDYEQARAALYIASLEFKTSQLPKNEQGFPRNFLFTMTEGTTVPDKYLENLRSADYVITPSTWAANTLKQYRQGVAVVNHGVDPIYTYQRRNWKPGKKFRFLWVGAPNARKGYAEVVNTWAYGEFVKHPKLELYIKTNRAAGVQSKGNVIVDGRSLTPKQMVALYHSADAFLFPTRGEGFGLSLAEAMRTGLPCIATNYSGVTDFFDESVGFTLDYELKESETVFVGEKLAHKTLMAYPYVDQMASHMVWILSNYKAALDYGHAASKRIRAQFTWERSAEKLLQIIREVCDNYEKCGHNSRVHAPSGTPPITESLPTEYPNSKDPAIDLHNGDRPHHANTGFAG